MNCKLINILFVFLSVLTSCKGTLDLSAHVHVPYCGGAKPTPEMEKGRLDPVDTVLITKVSSRKMSMIQIPLDINGFAQIKLPKGDYNLFHKNKGLSIEELKKLYLPTNNKWYTYKGDSCLMFYISTPDLGFKVSKKTEYKALFRSRCFTGVNPCIIYNGPLPP